MPPPITVEIPDDYTVIADFCHAVGVPLPTGGSTATYLIPYDQFRQLLHHLTLLLDRLLTDAPPSREKDRRVLLTVQLITGLHEAEHAYLQGRLDQMLPADNTDGLDATDEVGLAAEPVP